MTIQATITADLFRRAFICVSTDPHRDYISGVRVEPHKDGGTILIATDGHKMAVIRDVKGFASEAFTLKLPKAMLKDCKPSRQVQDPMIWIEDGSATLNGIATKDWLVGGTYPDWRRVLPEVPSDAGCMASFDNRVLADLAEALTADKMQALVIRGKDAHSPHAVFGTLGDAFGVAMPMRTSHIAENQTLPVWL